MFGLLDKCQRVDNPNGQCHTDQISPVLLNYHTKNLLTYFTCTPCKCPLYAMLVSRVRTNA